MSRDGFLSRLPIYRHIKNEMVKRSEIRTATQRLLRLGIADYIERNLEDNPKYDDPRRLARSEFSVFSQYGEDGAIREIFRRIGETNRFFVELGVGTGVENNTVYLLTKHWRGAWVEGGRTQAAEIGKIFAAELKVGSLSLWPGIVTAANVESVLSELHVPEEPDLLSLDVDYGTYWVWRGTVRWRPRVVVIEYNAAFPPSDDWVVGQGVVGKGVVGQGNDTRSGATIWDGSSHMGASLGALCRLGETKGYSLVGCTFAGGNAFFVRSDLAGMHFCEPYTAQNHYEPARYFLYHDPGHRRGWGPFVSQ